MDSANPALAAAAIRLCVTRTAAVRMYPTMNCIRNSQPMVGIDRYPVKYRYR